MTDTPAQPTTEGGNETADTGHHAACGDGTVENHHETRDQDPNPEVSDNVEENRPHDKIQLFSSSNTGQLGFPMDMALQKIPPFTDAQLKFFIDFYQYALVSPLEQKIKMKACPLCAFVKQKHRS